MTKADVRDLARKYGLTNHGKPAYTCLLTRFPVGWHISMNDLEKVGKAESLLRELGFTQVRLRHHGNIARIETDPADFPLLLNPEIRKQVVQGVKALGYDFVALDLEGYRFGSME